MSFFPNPITASNTTTARSLPARFGDVLNVKDFGARGEASIDLDGYSSQFDDAPAIQAAINKAIELNASRVTGTVGGASWLASHYFKGTTVYVPRGVYRIASNINWGGTVGQGGMASGIRLVGDDYGGTVFMCDRPSGDIITVGNFTDRIDNTQIQGITFYSVPKMTSGSIIRVINGYNSRLDNLRFPENPKYPDPLINRTNPSTINFNSAFTRIYTCIEIDGGISFQNYISNVNINNGEYGIVVGVNGLCQDIFFIDTIVAQCVNSGFLIKQAGGVNFNNAGCIYCNVGISIYPDSGKNVYWVSGAMGADTCVQDGIRIITNGGIVRGVDLREAWSSNHGRWQNDVMSSANVYPDAGYGIWIWPNTGTIGGVSIRGGQIYSNRKHGIYVQPTGANSISSLKFTGLQVSANSAWENNAYDGIHVAGDQGNFQISNCATGDIGINYESNKERYGINISGSGSNNYSLVGNMFYNDVSGRINNASSGALNKVDDNNLYL